MWKKHVIEVTKNNLSEAERRIKDRQTKIEVKVKEKEAHQATINDLKGLIDKVESEIQLIRNELDSDLTAKSEMLDLINHHLCPKKPAA